MLNDLQTKHLRGDKEIAPYMRIENIQELAAAIGSSGGGVSLTNKQKFYELMSTSSKIVWIGDSITEDATGYRSLIEGLFPEKNFISEAVGGYTTKDVLDNIVSFTAHSPDLYIVAIGVNDVRYNDSRGAVTQTNYLANMLNILTPLKNAAANVVVISIWPSFWRDNFSALLHKATNEKITQYNTSLAKLCADNSCYYIDSNSVVNEYVNIYNAYSISTDGIHPAGQGVELYAQATLVDKIEKGRLTSELSPSGKHFFKLKILDPKTVGNGGYCGIKNISTEVVENIGVTANTAYTTTNLFGAYNSSGQFYNKAADYPFYLTFSTNEYPTEAAIAGAVSGTGVNRGPKAYIAYYSTNPDAMSDLDHPSWEVVNREMSTKALAVNMLPQARKGVFYMLIANGAGQLDLKRIGASKPIKVWIQNIIVTSAQRFADIFDDGVTNLSDALKGNLPSYVVIWESETELDSIVLESFGATLQSYTIKKSFNPDSINNPSHASWKTVGSGTGDGTVTL